MTFQLTNGQVDRGPDSCDGQTLVGIVLDASYTFQADHANATDVTGHEVAGGGYGRLAGDATSDLVTDTGIRTVYLEDVTTTTTDDAIGGIAWFLPGASDTLRLYVGYSPDPTPAGTYEPTYPDGLYTYTVDPGPSTLIELDDVQGLPADGEVPTWDNAEGMFVFAASGAGGETDAAPVACPPGEITPVVVTAGIITAHKYVFEEGGIEGDRLLALPPAADHIGQVITQAFEIGALSGPVVEVIPPDPDRKPSLDFTAWYAALDTTDFGGGDSVDFDLDGVTVTVALTGSMDPTAIISALLGGLVAEGATVYSSGAVLFVSSPTEGGSISITDPGAELDFAAVVEYGLGGFIRAIDETGGGLDADQFYGAGTDNPDYEFIGEGFGTHSSPTGGFLIQRGVEVLAIPDRRVFSGARWTAVDWPIRSEHVPYSLAAPGGTDYFSNVHAEIDKLLNFQSDAPGTYAYEVELVDVDGVNVPTITLTTPGGGGGSVATDGIFDVKGDLPVGTGSNTAARLAAGANDTMLMAASGEATGLKWGDAATVKSALSLENVTNHAQAIAGRVLTAGTGLTGGGDLSADRTFTVDLGVTVQAYDADLTAIAGLSPSNDDILQRKSGGWTFRTPAQVMADLMPLMAGSTALSVFSAPSASVGTYAPTAGSNAVYLISSSSAVNDYIEWSYFPLAAGTYTVSLTHMTGTGNGQLRISIDGTNIGGGVIESYAASTAAAREVITSVSVASSGFHTVRITTPSKNASSSAYVMRLVDLAFARTA